MRYAIAALVALSGLPAMAQTPPDAGIKAFFQGYVQAFNKGDSHALATQFYESPGVSPAELEATLAKQFAALRADEFGKMNLFSMTSCMQGATQARVQVSFEYQFTYGGQMPPGDQMAEFALTETKNGWRIVSRHDLNPGQSIACAQ